jgi:hypothetical protein
LIVYAREKLHESAARCSPHVRQIGWFLSTFICCQVRVRLGQVPATWPEGSEVKALLCAVLFVAGIAEAEVPDAPTEHQPRELGIRAVMNVYYISSKTLEITSTAQFGWATLDACQAGMAKGMAIAQPYASEGDLVEVQCFAAKNAPKAQSAQKTQGTTDL